jgi:hypothetical protein
VAAAHRYDRKAARAAGFRAILVDGLNPACTDAVCEEPADAAAMLAGALGDVMLLRALVGGACLAALLAACAVVDPVDSRYDTVSRSLTKARDEAIFLNLVRASHDYPLAFTTIANVTPTLTNTSTFGLPSFLLGPSPGTVSQVLTAAGAPMGGPTILTGSTTLASRAATLGSTTASNTTAISTNFNVATQETSAFYLGFLKPIDLQTLAYFIRQDYPRELLFWLFADSFQFQYGPSPRNAYGYQYDPPDSYGCPKDDLVKRCFREWIWIALLSGLTVEEKSIVKEQSPNSAPKETTHVQTNVNSSGKASKTETVIVARFCFSPELAKQAENRIDKNKVAEIKAKYMRDGLNPSPLCGTWTGPKAREDADTPQPDTFDFNIGPYKFHVVPRSAYGVFEFLGNMIKMQRDNIQRSEQAFYWRDDELDIPPLLLTVHDDPSLFTVVPSGTERCFAHTWFYDGDYCVPESARTTKRIFSLLAQLIAIETAATDLSITPVVRIIQ